MPCDGIVQAVLGTLLLALSWANAGAIEIRGEAVQSGLLQGRVDPASRVLIDGRPVRVSEQGVFLAGFSRDDHEPLVLDVIGADGSSEQLAIRPRVREYSVQRIDGLPSRKVNPKPEDLKRIRRDAALVKAARRTDDPRTDFLEGFEWPVKGVITGVYGSQRLLNGQPKRPHYGIDIAAPIGTPVTAPAGGVVTLADPDMFYSGGTLIVDHGHGLSSAFLHLSRIRVEVGDRVEQGDVIAEVGATGRGTGAHLDWRINLFDKRLDPELLAGPMAR